MIKRMAVEVALASVMGLVIGYVGTLMGMTTEQSIKVGLVVLALAWFGMNWLAGNK